MAAMLRVHRSRGAASGMLLILLGAWGGLVPFVGPYAHYAYTPDSAWHWSSGRLWLDVLPGAATLVGGLIVLLTRLRPVALLGALLAAISGAWFAVSTAVAPLAPVTLSQGTPAGGPVARAMEQIGFFSGLGVVIVLTASVAMGRLAMISSKDMRAAAAHVAAKADKATASKGATDSSGTPGKARTGDITTADTITSGAVPGGADKRGWRLVGRASTGRDSSAGSAS